MTKREYELIADVISSLAPSERVAAALAFVPKLAAENPRFDKRRFLKACGIEGLKTPDGVTWKE